MAGMYPDNQELTIFGEKVQWPGVNSSGKFTNGGFTDPMEKPSFIPAETINLILDNLSGLIKKLGGTPNNTSIDQLAKLFTVAATANTGIQRDAKGCAKVAAPQEADDIARKKEVDDGKAYAHAQDNEKLAAAKSYADSKDAQHLAAAKSYTNEKTAIEANARTSADAAGLVAAKQYTNELLIKIFQNGYIQWPGMPTPGSIFSFPGYRWSKVNYNGCFFRAEGKDALPFNGGEQGDAIRNIKGFVKFDSGNIILYKQGVFDFKNISRGRSWAAQNNWDVQQLEFDASKIVPTAPENRPRNRTIVIWKLEKA